MSKGKDYDDTVLDFYAWREVVHQTALKFGVGLWTFSVMYMFYGPDYDHCVEVDLHDISNDNYMRGFITVRLDQLTRDVAELVVLHLQLGIPCDNLKKIS